MGDSTTFVKMGGLAAENFMQIPELRVESTWGSLISGLCRSSMSAWLVSYILVLDSGSVSFAYLPERGVWPGSRGRLSVVQCFGCPARHSPRQQSGCM